MADDWTVFEVVSTIEDYFVMARSEFARLDYNKSEHRRKLSNILPERSQGSIEFKHQNISAVLVELGLPYIAGYKPRFNYQRLLKLEVQRYLRNHPSLQNLFDEYAQLDVQYPEVDNILKCLVSYPQADINLTDLSTENRVPYNSIDYYLQEVKNRKLGLLGEEFIIKYEKCLLSSWGLKDLSREVEQVSVTRGDSAGFDILSFDKEGKEKFIEVKTTKMGEISPFYFTRNELSFSIKERERYRLYRLFHFSKKPRFYQLTGSLENSCGSIPTQYMGWPKNLKGL